MEELSNGYVEQLNKFSTISIVPKGNSMYPTLKNKGQSVILKKKTEKLVKMDMALYVRNNGTCVLHRVIEVKADGYVFCGDARWEEEFVLENQVIGVVTEYYRGNKLIKVTDTTRKKAQKFFDKKLLRKIRIKPFLFCCRVKSKIKRIFKK